MDHRIEKFMAVVEAKSFTDAAKSLHVSQPSLSIAIKNLENELGATLIIRGGRFFQVTDEGKLVYEYGLQSRVQLQNLKTELAQEIKSQKLLRIGMIDSVASWLFQEGSFEPGGTLEVRIDNSSRLLRSLRLDQLDMAIITKPFGSVSEEYRTVGEYDEKFSLVCSPSRYKQAQKQLKQGQIQDFLTYDQSSTTIQWMNHAMNQQRTTYSPKFFSTNPELMKLMALKGQGIALLPSNLLTKEIKAQRLVLLKGFKFTRPIAVVCLNDKFVSEQMENILKQLNKVSY